MGREFLFLFAVRGLSVAIPPRGCRLAVIKISLHPRDGMGATYRRRRCRAARSCYVVASAGRGHAVPRHRCRVVEMCAVPPTAPG